MVEVDWDIIRDICFVTIPAAIASITSYFVLRKTFREQLEQQKMIIRAEYSKIHKEKLLDKRIEKSEALIRYLASLETGIDKNLAWKRRLDTLSARMSSTTERKEADILEYMSIISEVWPDMDYYEFLQNSTENQKKVELQIAQKVDGSIKEFEKKGSELIDMTHGYQIYYSEDEYTRILNLTDQINELISLLDLGNSLDSKNDEIVQEMKGISDIIITEMRSIISQSMEAGL